MRPLNSLKVGAKFLAKKYNLDTFEKYQLMELGIIPNTTLEIMQKNFSFVIIKCRGAKLAISESVARKLIGCEG